jgi:hypothetical protein
MTLYVLCIEQNHGELDLSVHASLSEAEDALRNYARGVLCDGGVGMSDQELVAMLLDDDTSPRIFECNKRGSVELVPFEQAA